MFADGWVHDTGHEGIDVKEGSNQVRILRNRFWNVERQDLCADAWDSETGGIVFDGNTVYNCTFGIAACTETGGLLYDVVFRNNVIDDCRGPGMIVADNGSSDHSHRIVNLYFVNNSVLNCGNRGSDGRWSGGMLFENAEAETSWSSTTS